MYYKFKLMDSSQCTAKNFMDESDISCCVDYNGLLPSEILNVELSKITKV